MASIDITLPDELVAALTPPVCADLQLPSVSAQLPSVSLPIGGSIQGMADFTRGIPTDCSMNFSLLLQLAPIMVSMECLLKILKFVTTVVGVIKDITSPLSIVSAIPKIVAAAEDLASCLAIVIPVVGQACFIKSLLELIAKMILCTVSALESILKVLIDLEVQLAAALAAGNGDLLASLQCAQENANTSASSIMLSLQPITLLLELAKPFLEIAQVSLDIEFPAAINPSELEAMESMLEALGSVAKDILIIAEAIPC